VPHVRLTCPGLPWGVRGPKKMGAAQTIALFAKSQTATDRIAQDAGLGASDERGIVPQGTAESGSHVIQRMRSDHPPNYCLMIALYPSDSSFCLTSAACMRLANGPT
jgi:hypothetical protein